MKEASKLVNKAIAFMMKVKAMKNKFRGAEADDEKEFLYGKTQYSHVHRAQAE